MQGERKECPACHGHMTLADGGHVPLTADQAKALVEECDRHRKERAERLPDEKTSLNAMFEAYDRLRELGWREAIYCPKDGSEFEVIEAGSTGIHRCMYSGEWPNGHYLISDGGDLWPSRPIIFRSIQPEISITTQGEDV